MALDPKQHSPGYQLGRLFALLERGQEMANPNINAKLRERYYSAASTTPLSVMPRLLDLNQKHSARIRRTKGEGARVWLERQITSVVEGLDAFPRALSLEEQGRFAIGYYHQRHALFEKSTPDADEAAAAVNQTESEVSDE